MSTPVRLPLADALDLGLGCVRATGCAGGFSVHRSDGWKVSVRNGRAELVQSTTNMGLHVTIYAEGGRTGAMSSGDLSESGVRDAVRIANELAAVGDADPWSQPAPEEECGLAVDPDLDDPEWSGFTPDDGIRMVVEGEAAARAVDPRITLSDLCGGSAGRSEWLMANTNEVQLGGARSSAAFHIVAIAQQGEERQMSWHGTHGSRRSGLRTPAAVGHEAGRKAIEKFCWKKATSGQFPVILDRDAASDFLGILHHSLSGDAVYRKRTWCTDLRGTLLANPLVTVIDDPHLFRAPGSRRCDHDGVKSRRIPVISAGRLEHFLVSGYAARRLGHPYTGHSGGPSNLHLMPGQATLEDLQREAYCGMLVTGFNGWGVDITAGTFSRGVIGFWIEDGRISHPIQETTVAGKLSELWQGIRGIGNDPDPEHAVSSPCLLIDGFTIGGT